MDGDRKCACFRRGGGTGIFQRRLYHAALPLGGAGLPAGGNRVRGAANRPWTVRPLLRWGRVAYQRGQTAVYVLLPGGKRPVAALPYAHFQRVE